MQVRDVDGVIDIAELQSGIRYSVASVFSLVTRKNNALALWCFLSQNVRVGSQCIS